MAEFIAELFRSAFGVMASDGFIVAVLMLLIGRYMKSWGARYASGFVFAGILCSFFERPPESYPGYLLAGILWVALGHAAVMLRKVLQARRG